MNRLWKVCQVTSVLSLRFLIKVSQRQWKSLSCVRLCDPMDYIVHGILQARILGWVAFPFSRGSSATQGSNPGLLHCTQILYQLSYQGSQNFKWPLYSGIIGCNTFYLLLLLRFQDILNVSFWKLKEIILLTFPERMLPLKKPTTTKPLAWSKEIFPQMVT